MKGTKERKKGEGEENHEEERMRRIQYDLSRLTPTMRA